MTVFSATNADRKSLGIEGNISNDEL